MTAQLVIFGGKLAATLIVRNAQMLLTDLKRLIPHETANRQKTSPYIWDIEA
jgi:hypothetical protein